MQSIRWAPAVVLASLLSASPAAAQFGRLPPWPIFPPPYSYPVPVVVPVPVPAAKDNRAVIHIRLPSTANDIWVEGHKMPTRETASRVFVSPPLEPGHNYTYTVRAAWPTINGMVTQQRDIVIGANRTATVDFTRPEPMPTPKKQGYSETR